MASSTDLLLSIALKDAPRPHEAHARLAARHETTFILESREGPQRLARHSFVGFAPVGVVRLDREGLHVHGAMPAPHAGEAPLDYLRRLQAAHPCDEHAPPFAGGLVGSIGYDFGRLLEPSLDRGVPEAWPRFLFGLYLDGLVYDHVQDTCHYVSQGEDRSPALLDALAQPAQQVSLHIGAIRSAADRASFVAAVDEAQRLIRAGECFQIVLSRPYQAGYDGQLTPLYTWLRDRTAVPYLYHLRFEDGREVLGASPEMLVRVRGGRAETFPIAGTRPVTGDARRDQAAGEELRRDRKETAEHAMLVDLARNDLSRVCRPGTVQVAAHQELHRFGPVQHLVSQVVGDLDAGQDALAALAAVFPAGTVSGAPKVRAMEHIDTLEQRGRGAYAGAVAYLSFNGDLDSAIAIRSLSSDGERITVQAGAGIVVRSDPEAEFRETRHKADTLLDALRAFGATIAEDLEAVA